MSKLAIMQPTFLPWIGYFALMDYVDKFVFLDDVQLSKRSWQTRNRIKTSQQVLTICVPCKQRRTKILETLITNPSFYHKSIRSIKMSYSKAPYVDEVIELLEKTFESKHEYLGGFNQALIEDLKALLGIDTPCLSASALNVTGLSKSDRLFKICTKVGAAEYVSPPSAINYIQQNNAFLGSSIELRFFQFEHPVYPQLHGKFVSHLSVIDAIANLGSTDTLSLMRAAVRPSLTFSEMLE